jgi:serine protease Do
MDKFVCVRLVQGNGLDLSLFQFDYDLTFAVFFLHPDGTILGRYGTRSSHDEAERDISLVGFRKGMEKALELFQDFPSQRSALAAKRGAVVQSCIHCHQIWDQPISKARESSRPITDEELYPYPMPDVLGLKLDPQECATVASVKADSPAAKAGFREGDNLVLLNGQPLVSTADVQWVLHHAKATDTLTFVVRREGSERKLTIPLFERWRRGDLAWRSTTWELRRMGTGGLFVADLDDAKRQELKLDDDRLALLVKHVGQYGDHALAKKEGFLNNDIITSIDGRQERLTETQFLDYMLRQKKRGQPAEATVRRGEKELRLKVPTQ